MFDQFTLGIEEEFQIVDPTTRELKSHVSEILEEGKLILGEKLKPEMIQSMIEVGTGICHNIQEVREDISRLRCIISGLARKKGLEIVAASTHPVFALGRPGNFRRRALRLSRRRTADGRPQSVDFWFARSRRHRR